jgi:hydroxymethylglutaryl-CoA reductase
MSRTARSSQTESPTVDYESGQFRVAANAGLRDLDIPARVREVVRWCGLSEQDVEALSSGALSHEVVDSLIENAIGTFELPLGVAVNFVVNGREHVVPMATEEPSVIASASLGAKIVRGAGGFVADADDATMIAQVEITGGAPFDRAREAIELAREEILDRANASHPELVRRGGGAKAIEVRSLDGAELDRRLVVHVLVDTCDAMGANVVNGMAEGVAPLLAHLTSGTVRLRILSNLADRRLARARCAVPIDDLAAFGRSGQAIAEGIAAASRFAEIDPYRAATHNKGVMNGIDAVAIATGNDWRAIEAGAHAYAARAGRYGPLSTWKIEGERLVGAIELPLAVGTVGRTRVHPTAKLGLRIAGAPGARELARLMAAVGLAQNLAALRVLGSVGIQRGHMALHARALAVAAPEHGEAPGAGDAATSFRVVSQQEAAALPRHAPSRFRFRVPPGWRSPIACSPHATEAERAVLDWFTALGCTDREVARARKFDAAGYVGIPFPGLARDSTILIGKYLSMWLLWDDVQVENLENGWRLDAPSVLARRLPEGMTRFDHGWWQLFQDFAGRRSAGWIEDVCGAMATWQRAAHDEALMMRAWREEGALPDFAVQLEIRIATIGMYATVYLLEDAYGEELPRAFHAAPVVRRLKRLANKIVGLGNDVLSFGKDVAEGQINLISTLMRQEEMQGDEALAVIIAMHDRALAEYDRLAEGLAGGRFAANAALVERWLRDVRYASLGFSVWESAAPRYAAHKIVARGAVVEPSFLFLEGE